MAENIRFRCLEILQPIGVFYVGVMNWDDLVAISRTDVRRLVSKEREIENYMGRQRPLSLTRAKEIGQYTNLSDACFPTGILLAIPEKYATFDSSSQMMTITNEGDVAKVLDGQHRIAGLEYCNKKGEEFQINVSIFIEMELEDQAIVFATINSTHEKVSKSLAADLHEFSKRRSPQKTAHNVVKALNEKNGSPFKDKIKILGVADDKEKETITQATFVESILQYLTKNKAIDRDIYRQGKQPPKFKDEELKKYFFRNLFIDEKDSEIAKIIWNYFKAVQTKWPDAWDKVQPDIILNRSTGLVAFMRFLKDCYLKIVGPEIGNIPSTPQFLQIFDKISLKDADFNKHNFKPGGTGRSQLYQKLKEDAKI
jgi:DGQHR domain-containing protein